MCDKKPKMSHIKKLECNQGGDLKIFIECCNADPEEIFLNTTLMEWKDFLAYAEYSRRHMKFLIKLFIKSLWVSVARVKPLAPCNGAMTL
ncbi:MAG: hypothetical protein KH200_18020 [Clostridium sp.]|nr:hypothetical protein [Clostridium sp.]